MRDIIDRKTITKKALKYLPVDNECEHLNIISVRENKYKNYDIETGNGFIITPKMKFVPKVGMTIDLYGKGFGYTVRGMVIDGKVIYYRTEEEAEKDHVVYCAEQDKLKKEKFAKSKKAMDKRFDALPVEFQERISVFRRNNPDFRWEYEGYEMFATEEAIKIANTLKTGENIKRWKELPYEDQIKEVAISDGHSGNTFGYACTLAYYYVENKEMLKHCHGAMCVLVGCKDYGCSNIEK